MSFRVENKFIINNEDIFNFKNKIIRRGNKLFEDRIVKSIYFDNSFFSSYHDSTEGLLPRKKIRIRSYDNVEKFSLEKKISSVEGRFKTSYEIKKSIYINYLENGLYDLDYKDCLPVISVEYTRSYYNLKNIRFTLDRNIKYSHYQSNLKINESYNVVEIKSTSDFDFDICYIFFSYLTKSRFSKYTRAVDAFSDI